MYRTSSPYHPPDNSQTATQALYAQQSNSSVAPGDLTYTQIVGPDGRMLCQVYQAHAASYPTPSGLISGVQWRPTETTTIPPPGARPATSEFASAWMRSSKDDGNAFKDRQQKERESTTNRGHNRHASEYDSLREARERDAQSTHGRDRRSSFNIAGSSVPFPTGATGYPSLLPGGGIYNSSPYSGYTAIDSAAVAVNQSYGIPTGLRSDHSGNAYTDLNRQFNDMNMNRDKESGGERDSKNSEVRRSRKYSINDPTRAQTGEGAYGEYSTPYKPPAYFPPSGAYSNPVAYPAPANAVGYPAKPSPNLKSAEILYGSMHPSGYPISNYSSTNTMQNRGSSIARSISPVGGPQVDICPAGHIIEGQPKRPSIKPKSRAASPNPVPSNAVAFPPVRPPSRKGASPHPLNTSLSQLAAPEAFSRAINATLPYFAFKPIKVQDMNEFFDHMPRMPNVLESHDIRHDEWFRFMEDLTLAWTGRLPVVARHDGKFPRTPIITAELIQTWNTTFFEPRGIEVILYKGRQRRSGRFVGRVDLEEDKDGYSSSSTSSSSSGSEDDYAPPGLSAGPYGHPTTMSSIDDLAAARRRYHDAKKQAKERRRERRKRRRERRKSRKYVFYVSCIREEGGPKLAYPGMQATCNPSQFGAKTKTHSRGHSIGGNY